MISTERIDNHLAKDKFPVTPAIRFLRKQKVEFTCHPYPYQERGGTKVSSRELGVPENQVVKTLVALDEKKQPFLILMHGDCEVSFKELARVRGVKTVSSCEPKVANRLTGYQVGGISPFGTRKALQVYMEESILELERLFINGGKRGFLVSLSPADLETILDCTLVSVKTCK